MLQRTDPALLKQLDAGVDLSKPSLKGLSYLLRNRDQWPEGFRWNFGVWAGCAVGLAMAKWSANADPVDFPKVYGLSHYDTIEIFTGDGPYPRETVRYLGGLIKRKGVACDHGAVTPEMVADQIDRYLATA